MMYADYEENFGLLSYAMEIYDRATRLIPNTLDIWNIYLSKAMLYFGVVRSR